VLVFLTSFTLIYSYLIPRFHQTLLLTPFKRPPSSQVNTSSAAIAYDSNSTFAIHNRAHYEYTDALPSVRLLLYAYP
jgi:hypothetical protein